MPKSPSDRTLREDVRDQIREGVISGEFYPGSRLVERTIAADLGVSRVPVREALRALVTEGFAVDRATRGIAVRAYNATELAELADVGAALERILVGSIAENINAGGLARLREVLDLAQNLIDTGHFPAAVAANAEFHEVLADLAAGTITHEVLGFVGARRRWLLSQHSDPAPIHAEHRALYEALADGDRTRAEQLVEAHAQTTTEHALKARKTST